MSAEIPAARVRLIGRIIVAARSMARKSSSTDGAAFLQALLHRASLQEDLLARDPEYLARVAMAHRRAGEQRAPGRSLVCVLDGELGAGAAHGPAHAGGGGHRRTCRSWSTRCCWRSAASASACT